MADFVLKLEGARQMDLLEWERTRTVAYMVVKPYLKNKSLTIERFMPLPTDKKKKGDRKPLKGRPVKEVLESLERKKWTKES